MAIKLIGNYAKRLGLPGYSSHQFSVSVETELTDSKDIQGEAARIYHLLQDAVDREIQQTGFVPGDEYGLSIVNNHDNGNGHQSPPPSNGDGGGSDRHAPINPNTNTNGAWQCSDKQCRLITNLANELGLSDADLDQRSQRLFQKPASQLNKLTASGLISDLLAEAGTKRVRNGGNGNDARQPVSNRRNGGGA